MKGADRAFAVRLRYAVTGAVVLICLGVVVGTGTIARGTASVDGDDAPPLSVAAGRVALQTGYEVPRTFVGRVEARQQSEVGFEVGGLVLSVYPDEGDNIIAGAEVAALDTTRLEARRAEVDAALGVAEASRRLAELTLGRTRESHRRGAASFQDLDIAEQSFLAALAEERRVRASSEAIGVDITKSVIRAPFDAIVSRRLVDAGRVVGAGEPVAVLLERGAPQVRLGLGGVLADGLAVGERVSVTVSERSIKGTVLRVLPVRDGASRNVTVIVGLDAFLGEVRQGDLAHYARETTVAADGFWVPMRAITESERGLWSLYRIVERSGPGAASGSVLARVEVELLHAETERAFVRGPLRDGDSIVVDGLHRVAPGMRVSIAGHTEGIKTGADR